MNVIENLLFCFNGGNRRATGGDSRLDGKRIIGRKIWVLFGIVCFQALIVITSSYFSYAIITGKKDFCPTTVLKIFIVVGSLCSIAAMYLIYEINRLAKVERELVINHLLLEKSQDLVSVLSNHRHDFRNHLQVILGLLQLNRIEVAINYIKEVNMQLSQQSSTAHKIKNLEVAALLFTKKAQAEEKEIKLQLELETDLADLAIPPTDLTRILGNLIDNALDAVAKYSEEDLRAVCIKFQETADKFTIIVLNKLPLIPFEIQQQIFHKGFTTKGLGGNGLGLPIVKELTEKNGGEIYLNSNEELGTLFILNFPKEPSGTILNDV